jgi:ketosteroid isomerase-like protein
MPSYADDRAEIEDLMARYLFALDFFDADAYAETFAEDGVLDWAMGTVEGREAIRAEAAGMKASMASVFGAETTIRHFVTNIAISVEGERASTRAAWFEAYNNGPDGAPKMGTFGHYEDELARIDGRWLFKRRRIVNEFLEGRKAGPDNPVRGMEATQ